MRRGLLQVVQYRCSFQQILEAYRNLRAPQWIINMHAAFLCGRKMRVKVGGVLSEDVPVTGRAVQGSILGVLDHNAVLEDVEENLSAQAEKYFDDLTLFEPILVGRPGLVEDNGVASYQARSCQRGLELLEETCLQKGLKINEKKDSNDLDKQRKEV